VPSEFQAELPHMKSQRDQRTFLVDAALRYIAGDVTGLETDQNASERAAET